MGNLHAILRKTIQTTSKSKRESYAEQGPHCRGCPDDGGHFTPCWRVSPSPVTATTERHRNESPQTATSGSGSRVAPSGKPASSATVEDDTSRRRGAA